MKPNEYRYIFGPVPSRRFGRSLGIDLTPHKTCSLNCVFCQLGPTPVKTLVRKVYVPTNDVIAAVDRWLESGVDQDYRNLMKQGTRAAIADGWGGSMLATDLQDVLFGTPYPLQSEANLGVTKADHVNIVIHGHEPILSEMIVAVSQKPEMQEYAKSKGAHGIQIAGFGVEAIQYHLGGTFRGSYYTLNDNIINGRIRGIAGVVGCNNARTRHIDKKRSALGIDKARARTLVDMAARRELAAV